MERLVLAAETLSLVLVLAVFILFARQAARIRASRSLPSELFVFSLLIVVSEIPRILSTLGTITRKQYETVGLTYHTFAMGFLAVAIAYRSYRERLGSLFGPVDSRRANYTEPNLAKDDMASLFKARRQPGRGRGRQRR